MFEALNYLNPLKVFPALKKAFDKAKEEKDKSFFEKVSVFADAFFNEMKEVKEEKEDLSNETKEKVQKDIDGAMAKAKEEVKASSDVPKKQKEVFEETLAAFQSSMKEAGAQIRVRAYKGFKKIEKSSNGDESATMTVNEAKAVSALSIMTLRKLKKEYPDKEKFEEMLVKFYKASKHSKIPLDRMLGAKAFHAFKVLDFAAIKKKMKSLNPASLFSLKDDLKDIFPLLNAFGIGITNAKGIYTKLSQLGKAKMPDRTGVVAVFKKYFFPNSDNDKIVEVLHNLIAKKKDPSPEDLSTLVFAIDDKDFGKFEKVLRA